MIITIEKPSYTKSAELNNQAVAKWLGLDGTESEIILTSDTKHITIDGNRVKCTASLWFQLSEIVDDGYIYTLNDIDTCDADCDAQLKEAIDNANQAYVNAETGELILDGVGSGIVIG